jgi:hypothetical protein
MVDAYELMKRQEYRKAWDLLERSELNLRWIRKNPFLPIGEFLCDELAEQVTHWQKIFPYKVFASPEIRIKREQCSICGNSSGPWPDCAHIVGKVYGGKFCSRTVTDMDFLGIALVLEPVQKYSVVLIPGPNGEDMTDYSLVREIVERVGGPFSWWRADWTTRRHPHELFADREIKGDCPCGSGRTYEACCLNEAGVLRPHLQVAFDEEKDPKHLKLTYLGYNNSTRKGVADTKAN